MTERKQKPPADSDTSLGKALERLIQRRPKVAAESLVGDVIQSREQAKKRIQKARQEIEDGALPRKGRFRL